MKAAVHKRRTVPISAFVGANGSGKSLMAAESLRHSLLAGRPVLSAVRLLDPLSVDCVHPECDAEDHGQDGHIPSHAKWVPLRRMSTILDFAGGGGGDVFLDEVGSLVSSRESASLPPQIAGLLQQLRKGDNRLIWTAPSWARADKILREVTMMATLCTGHGYRKIPGREWRQRRWIHAVSYDASALDDFEASKVNSNRTAVKPRKLVSEWARVARIEGRNYYQTFEPTPMLGFVGMAGTCVNCGGRRTAPKCSCADHADAPVALHSIGRNTGVEPASESRAR